MTSASNINEMAKIKDTQTYYMAPDDNTNHDGKPISIFWILLYFFFDKMQ
jgi:hypothetical protein